MIWPESATNFTISIDFIINGLLKRWKKVPSSLLTEENKMNQEAGE
jgi:hypothetical protein